jgi:hypothetical protein
VSAHFPKRARISDHAERANAIIEHLSIGIAGGRGAEIILLVLRGVWIGWDLRIV